MSIAKELFLKPQGKCNFIASLPPKARLLDVGCGNNSAYATKAQRPDIYYVGLDIEGCAQTGAERFADEYLTVAPEKFTEAIVNRPNDFDAVVSSHNIEHCNDPEATLRAMLKALKPGGRLYMSFPSMESVSFPKRGGCLNFFDDSTHRLCPDRNKIMDVIKSEGFEIDFYAARYRPPLLAFIGLVLEPWSYFKRQVMPLHSTWALYGFETIIWARRPA